MDKKITISQLCGILFQVMLAPIIGILSYISINSTKQDAWLTIIIAGILGLIPFLLYIYISNYNENMNIFEINECLFGDKFGKIINFIITISIIIYIIIYFYNMCNFITINYLNKTPNIFICLIFLIPLLYLMTQNLQVISRCLFIIFIFAIILHFFSFIGLINQINIENLKPVLITDFNNIFVTSLKILPFSVLCNISLLSIRKTDIINSKNLNKKLLITYILSFTIILLVILFIISVLGIELCNLYQFPEFNVLKRISLSRFIERAESTLSIHWILYIFSAIIFYFYFIKQYIKYNYKIYKVRKLNIIILIVIIITIILSNFVFKNITTANYIISNIIPVLLYIFNFAFIVLIAIKVKIKNKSS